ncbi:ABC transporter permease [Bosea sp. TWI1241]|uniref:ABC transporter permease n=1 Tax=Bosea sp. TWI1241 TaxID=3148904 RepID=UPI003207B905
MSSRRAGIAGTVALALVLLLPIAWGLTFDPVEGALRDSLRPPGFAFPLGTDHLGRDVLARIAHGFLLDIGLSLLVVALSFGVGTALGMVAAEVAGGLDRALSLLMDVTSALPQIVVALILAVHFGGGAGTLVIALAATGWVKYARIARAATFSLREREFVMAARVAGSGRLALLRRHVLPHLLPLFGGLLALQLGHTVLNIAALGFLGVGIQPPAPEWGAMIAEARPYLARAPWLAIAPGVFLFALTALALSLARALGRRRQAMGLTAW